MDIAANDPLAGINVAHALHFYSCTHTQSLRDKAKTALNKGVVLMLKEFGTTDASGNGIVNLFETNLWFSFMDENKLSRCNWSVADKIEASASLVSEAPDIGGWLKNHLTTSGLYIRLEIKDMNLSFQ